MSEEKKVIIPRLGKAAKEFNVATSTIVEFLSNKGFSVENNDNTKLTAEMYSLINQEYKSDKDVKEETRKIEIGTNNQKASVEDLPKEAEPAAAEKNEVFVKHTILIEDNEAEKKTKKTEKKEKIKVEAPKQKPKVVGKIDLEKPKPSKTESKKKTKKEEIKEEVVEEVVPQALEVEETIVAEVEIKEEAPKEEVVTVKKEPEKIELRAPKIESKIKIVDTIDLSSINERLKPKKKTKEELQKEKKERRLKELQEKEQQKAVLRKKDETRGSNKKEVLEKREKSDQEPVLYKPGVEKLGGPKILGKIQISDTKNAKKEDSHGDDGQDSKKKRKRIKSSPLNKDNATDFDKFAKPKKLVKAGKPQKVDFSEEEIDKQVKKTLARLAPLGKTKSSKHRKEKRELLQQETLEKQERIEKEKNILKVTEFLTANELANMMNIPVTQIITTCMSVGLAVAINQRLDAETITLLAENFGYQIQFVGIDEDEKEEEEIFDEKDMVERAPVVTVMGHVDHGKTSLLDYIRKTNVIAGEAGGITQHIGAYEVQLPNNKRITFLDTPGHEAFTAMRARGTKITDVAIIVIAADDSIMPQTVEAINHAQAAGVPMIFAINKIDKPGADPEKIRGALANMNLLVEEWGGSIQSQDISAKQGLNMDALLDKILIEAEMLELKANPNALASGTVIEASLDKGRGYIAKMLVQNGTLHTGDIVAAGTSFGKIRAMYNERNQLIKEAGPSSPVLTLGLSSAPQAGDTFKVYKEEREAKNIVNKRVQLMREQGVRTQKHITLDEIGRRIAIGEFKELNIIVKGDVVGSIEALADSLLQLSTSEVQVNVIHKSVGQVTESDVSLASASNAIIIAFQVRPSAGAKRMAEQEQVDIRIYSIIYDAINELKDAIKGMHAPQLKEVIIANIEVREVFHISKVGMIAGCYVLDGKIQRTTQIRVIRDGIVIHTGRLGSLKRFKDDVKEVSAGYECGLNIESFNDIKVGDIVEGFEQVEVKR